MDLIREPSEITMSAVKYISDVLSTEPKSIYTKSSAKVNENDKQRNLKEEIEGDWIECLSEIKKGVTITYAIEMLTRPFGKVLSGTELLTTGQIVNNCLNTLLKSRKAVMDEYPCFNLIGKTEESYQGLKDKFIEGYNNVVKAGVESNIPTLSYYCSGIQGDTTRDSNLVTLCGSFLKGELEAAGSMVDDTIEMFIDPFKTICDISNVFSLDKEDMLKIKDEALDYLNKTFVKGTGQERAEFAGNSITTIALFLLTLKAVKKPNTPALLAEESGVEIKVAEEAALKGGTDFRSTLSKLDLKGYEEFLKRTEGMFKTEKEAQKAFNELCNRNFKKFVKHFDFSTQTNKAFFWSGDKDFASKIAKKMGGTIMENTKGGKVIDGWDWINEKFPAKGNWGKGNTLDPKPLWRAASKEYAKGVSGKVTYVNHGYEGSIWLEDEATIVDRLLGKKVVTEVEYYNKEFIINKILDEGKKGW